MKILLIIFITFGSLFFINTNTLNDNILEEAIPIRENSSIKGINYHIDIKDSNKNKIIYSTKILDSIYHYTDISNLKNFIINLEINNSTKDKYYLKKIIIYNKDEIIKIYNYQSIINNSEVSFDLSNEILKKIYKDNKIKGNIKIVIEK